MATGANIQPISTTVLPTCRSCDSKNKPFNRKLEKDNFTSDHNNEERRIRRRTKSNEPFKSSRKFSKTQESVSCSTSPKYNGIYLNNRSQNSSNDYKTIEDMFGPDDVAKLDLVLANVNSLLDTITGECDKVSQRHITGKATSNNAANVSDGSSSSPNPVLNRHLLKEMNDKPSSLSRVQTQSTDKGFEIFNEPDEKYHLNNLQYVSDSDYHNYDTGVCISDNDLDKNDVIQTSFSKKHIHSESDSNITSSLVENPQDKSISPFNDILFNDKEKLEENKLFFKYDKLEKRGFRNYDDNIFFKQLNRFPFDDIYDRPGQRTIANHTRKKSEYDNIPQQTDCLSERKISDIPHSPEDEKVWRSSSLITKVDKKQTLRKTKSSGYAETASINVDKFEQQNSKSPNQGRKLKGKLGNLLPRRSVSLKQNLTRRVASPHRPRSIPVQSNSPKQSRKQSPNNTPQIKIQPKSASICVDRLDLESSSSCVSSSRIISTSFRNKNNQDLRLNRNPPTTVYTHPLRQSDPIRPHNLKLKIPSYRRAHSLDESAPPFAIEASTGFYTPIGTSSEYNFQRQPSIRKKPHKKLYRKLWDSFRHSQVDISPESTSPPTTVNRMRYHVQKTMVINKPNGFNEKRTPTPKLSRSETHLDEKFVSQLRSKEAVDNIDDSFFSNPYYEEEDGNIPRRQTIDSSYIRKRVNKTAPKPKPTHAEKHGKDLWKRWTKKQVGVERNYSSLPRPRPKANKSSSKANRLSWHNDRVHKVEHDVKSVSSSTKKSWRQNGKQDDGEDKIWVSQGTKETRNMGHCIWGNMGGRTVELEDTNLLRLSETECDALQDVALKQLHKINLGVDLTIPKDEFKMMYQKATFMKRYGIAGHHKSSKTKDNTHVFGIPLVRVVENDQLLRLQTQENECTAEAHSDDTSPKPARKGTSRCSTPDELRSSDNEDKVTEEHSSPSSSPGSPRRSPKSARACTSSGRHVGKPLQRRRAIAASSFEEIDPNQSKLLEALVGSGSREKKLSLIPHTMLQVPYVVQKCCAHITKHGLNVTGIFRVPGLRKRIKQLREEFDRGVDVQIDEDYNPHDVAALLKEFIRDLPEALLTRTLYSAFISVTKLPKSMRVPALQCIVWLLPIPNRDTLYSLLSFLHSVSQNADDHVNENREMITGNKMSVANIATIFGPNLLHRNKKTKDSHENHYQVQSADRAEESALVINVIQEMITNYSKLFQVPKNLHDEMLRTLKERDPEAVDFILRRKAGSHMREKCKDDFGEVTPDNDNDGSIFDVDLGQQKSPNDDNHKSNIDLKSSVEINETVTGKDKVAVSEDCKPLVLQRNSYQQATGHASFDISSPVQDVRRKSPEQKVLENNTIFDETDDSQNMKLSPPPISPTSRGSSVIYSPSFFEGRSVSFSEDDLKEIFEGSPKNRRNFRKLSEVNEEELSDHLDSEESLDQLLTRDNEANEENCPCKDVIEKSASDNISPGKRRGGFSVKPPTDSGLGSSASLTASESISESPKPLPRTHIKQKIPTNILTTNNVNLTADSNNNNTKYLAQNSPSTSKPQSVVYHDSGKRKMRQRLPSGFNLNNIQRQYGGSLHSHTINTNDSKPNNTKVEQKYNEETLLPIRTAIQQRETRIDKKEEEIPNKEELEKWRSWLEKPASNKTTKLHSQTLV